MSDATDPSSDLTHGADGVAESPAVVEPSADGGWRAAWASPPVRRARRVGYWALMIGLLAMVARRYMPDYRLPDLGPAPSLEHSDLDGATVRLDDFAGQVVVVNIWATWCPPCIVETPGFVDLADEFDGDVQFLGVSVDDMPGVVSEFADKYAVGYPMLVGANRAGPPWPAAVLPTTYVIDRRGHVRLRHEGLLLEPALRPVLKSLARESG